MTKFCAVLFFSSLCIATAQAQSIGFSLSQNSSSQDPNQITVTVLDDQTLAPIPGANVSITDALGFGRVSWRDRSAFDGTVDFFGLSPLPKTVTVSEPGYATLSVVGVEDGQMTAYLRPVIAQPKTVLATGTIKTWDGIGDDDSIMHAGLVFRTVSAVDLLRFQIANFISPLTDTLDLGSLGGKHKVPSNLVLPDQTIRYIFFHIEVNKPKYRLPIPASQNIGLTGVEAEASVSDVIHASSSHAFDAGFLNKLRITRVGITHDFSTGRDVQLDLDASLPVTPHHQVSISELPPFNADIMAASFIDQNGDKSVLIPTDAKTILSSQDENASPQTVTLGSVDSIPPQHRDVLTVAVGDNGQRLSGILVSPAGSSVETGSFMNTPSLPQDKPLPAHIELQAPQQGLGAAIFETDQPVWYVYTLPIAGSVSIPTAKLSSEMGIQNYSVNQLEFAGFNPDSLDGATIMSHLQRFARSSAKIKE